MVMPTGSYVNYSGIHLNRHNKNELGWSKEKLFKHGDKVIMPENGKTGTVTRIYNNYYFCNWQPEYGVQWDDGSKFMVNIPEKALQKIEEN